METRLARLHELAALDAAHLTDGWCTRLGHEAEVFRALPDLLAVVEAGRAYRSAVNRLDDVDTIITLRKTFHAALAALEVPA